MSLIVVLLIIVPAFMLLGSLALILKNRKEEIPEDPAPSNFIPAQNYQELEAALHRAQQQIQEIPKRSTEMEDMIRRLKETVDGLRSEVHSEKQTKLKMDTETLQKLNLVDRAQKLIDLNEMREKGATWEIRLAAEIEYSGGFCTESAWKLCREIEDAIRKRVMAINPGVPESELTFRQKVRMLGDYYKLDRSHVTLLNNAWNFRNRLYHEPGTQAILVDGQNLAKALKAVEDIP